MVFFSYGAGSVPAKRLDIAKSSQKIDTSLTGIKKPANAVFTGYFSGSSTFVLLLWCGWWDLNPHDFRSADFESAASAIPPQPRSKENYKK